jgi:hypothetical protein
VKQKILKEYTENHATAAEIHTKLNREAQKRNEDLGVEVFSPSHVDYRPPIEKIQKTIDNIQKSLRQGMTDVELTHEWLDDHQDIVLYPKDKKQYPAPNGIVQKLVKLLIS